MTDQQLFKMEEVAVISAQSRSRVWKDHKDGNLSSLKIGHQRRVTRAQLDAYVQWLTSQGTLHEADRDTQAVS